ncbi:hypothetical protein K432DRAFT_437530 [Lepidopterella palustris CBS 459.81]|uniref:DUF4419 domain-containing protein n=1 Tax=Lepidopterella palustris CBS 459.81 TaxID=1314670 RepID=A0A8E2E162_9PEZI|nr:hypothetical protein K432DRAFT_437530 [Lepidopterella palustris CBS 459.81]
MPVIIRPSPLKVGRNQDPFVSTANELLKATARAWSGASPWAESNKRTDVENRRIIQSSFKDLTGTTAIIPYGNGLVDGIIRAFNQDLHLVLRPDDIWLGIITQFNFFVNGNAEMLRSQFVSHKGKMRLTVDATPFSLKTFDMGKFAQEMTKVIHENVLDPELRDWIIPDFTTITDEDKSVASIVMMGTLQAYFEYHMMCGCGFPSVTLLGEKSDWEEIRHRILQLPKYHDEVADWSRILIPTIDHLIASFDHPDSPQIKDFWLRACHEAGHGLYDISTLSGWVTAFCFWDEDGKRIPQYSDEDLNKERWFPGGDTIEQRKRLVLNGVQFPLINPKAIPKSIVTVPVTIKDYEYMVKFETTMIAGSVGMIPSEGFSKVQPRSGWWMLEDSAEAIMSALQV